MVVVIGFSKSAQRLKKKQCIVIVIITARFPAGQNRDALYWTSSLSGFLPNMKCF